MRQKSEGIMAARRTLTRAQIIKAVEKHDDVLRQYAVARLGLFGSYAKKTADQGQRHRLPR